jgi:pSer/pThr/pTyr-binding forkhead associated (FHA) protein
MPSLRVHDASGVREYLLGDRTILGRDRAAEICIANAGLGRRHASIERRGSEYVVHDGGSNNGVTVGGERVERHALRPGDEFTLYDVRCEFLADPPVDPELSERPPVPLIVRVESEGAEHEHTIESDGLIGDYTFAGIQVGGGVRRHARVVAIAGVFWLEALDGEVTVAGEPRARVRLDEGVVVALGAARLVVRRRGAARLRVYTDEDPHAYSEHRLGASTRIGTRRINEIVLTDARVTREHCVIALEGEVYTIRDLDSTNGVLVNGERIEVRALRHGDRVTLGQTTCVFLEDLSLPTPGAAALRETFARAGLPAPAVPEPFAPLLQSFAPWWFGTRRTRGLYKYGTQLLAEADDPQVHDYLIVGHAGSGAHAYALHYFVRLGPLLLVLELGADGAAADPEVTRRITAEAFAVAETLLAAVPTLTRRGTPRAGLRVAASTVRSSHWRAGTEGGEGDWRAVLAAAQAWAAADTPFLARAGAGAGTVADIRRDRQERPPASQEVARVRVTLPNTEASEEYAIGDEVVIGRHTSCEVHVPLGWVSRRHCRVFMMEGFCWIEDLGSAQGTRVEGQTIRGPCLLAHGARVSIGQVEVVYCEAGSEAPPRTK